LAFWTREFPALPAHELPSWEIKYAPGLWLVPGLVAGMPRLFRAIRAETKVVEALVAREGIGWILSDNRYGVRHHGTPSVLVSHQLRLSLPRPFAPFEGWTEFVMARLARPFDEVWVPDFREAPGLSGKLGHPRLARFPATRWIGPLTRMERTEPVATRWESLAVISGPEPARSGFEVLLRQELSKLPGRHLLVLGRPDLPAQRTVSGNLEIANHLPGQELAREMQASKVVISRGGYSTLMDLASLGCRALLVPTPGQTEQEYLARSLAAQGVGHAAPQRSLRMERDLALAARSLPFGNHFLTGTTNITTA
jgi:hypothetical protein